eukprot:4662729-Amphidinium_carterae.1
MEVFNAVPTSPLGSDWKSSTNSWALPPSNPNVSVPSIEASAAGCGELEVEVLLCEVFVAELADVIDVALDVLVDMLDELE